MPRKTTRAGESDHDRAMELTSAIFAQFRSEDDIATEVLALTHAMAHLIAKPEVGNREGFTAHVFEAVRDLVDAKVGSDDQNEPVVLEHSRTSDCPACRCEENITERVVRLIASSPLEDGSKLRIVETVVVTAVMAMYPKDERFTVAADFMKGVLFGLMKASAEEDEEDSETRH